MENIESIRKEFIKELKSVKDELENKHKEYSIGFCVEDSENENTIIAKIPFIRNTDGRAFIAVFPLTRKLLQEEHIKSMFTMLKKDIPEVISETIEIEDKKDVSDS